MSGEVECQSRETLAPDLCCIADPGHGRHHHQRSVRTDQLSTLPRKLPPPEIVRRREHVQQRSNANVSTNQSLCPLLPLALCLMLLKIRWQLLLVQRCFLISQQRPLHGTRPWQLGSSLPRNSGFCLSLDSCYPQILPFNVRDRRYWAPGSGPYANPPTSLDAPQACQASC